MDSDLRRATQALRDAGLGPATQKAPTSKNKASPAPGYLASDASMGSHRATDEKLSFFSPSDRSFSSDDGGGAGSKKDTSDGGGPAKENSPANGAISHHPSQSRQSKTTRSKSNRAPLSQV